MFRAMTALGLLGLAAPALANVHETTATGFVTRHQIDVPADPDAAWDRLIKPALWWSKNHTYSGDAANLSLVPNAGGCFCEWLPDTTSPEKPPRGSVEHMRVIYVERGRALRMSGALGPLQADAAQGTLTIFLRKTDTGTRLMFEYVVGGYLRQPIDAISKAVDGVLGEQVASLGLGLGARIGQPSAPAPEAKAPARKQTARDFDEAMKGALEEQAPAPPSEAAPPPPPATQAGQPIIGR